MGIYNAHAFIFGGNNYGNEYSPAFYFCTAVLRLILWDQFYSEHDFEDDLDYGVCLSGNCVMDYRQSIII